MSLRTLIPAVVLFAVTAPAAAYAQDEIVDRIDRIYARGRYDRVFVEEGTRSTPRREGTGPGSPSRRPAPVLAADAPDWLASIISAIAVALPWIAALILGAAIALALGRRLRRPRPGDRHEPAQGAMEGGVRGAASAAPGATDPAALAAEDRFDEAVHAILLLAIARVAPRAAANPSQTSREIVRAAPLDDAARDAFRTIVRAVELSLFGGRATSAADYEACAVALVNIRGAE